MLSVVKDFFLNAMNYSDRLSNVYLFAMKFIKLSYILNTNDDSIFIIDMCLYV